jgi:capsular polysaccharide biosynthesis protein
MKWEATMEIDLKQYYVMLKKYLWIIVSLVIISTSLAALYSNYNYQPIYQASTKLIINNTTRSDQLGKSPFDFTSSGNTLPISTYKEIIKTPTIMEKLVQRHPDLDLTPEQIISRINVTAVNDTQLVAIVAIDSSQERAVRIANFVTEIFQSELPKILKIDNIAILNQAKEVEYPRPINQKSNRNILLAAIASMVIAVGLILFLDSMDDTMKSVKDVQALLDAPILAMIPDIKYKKGKQNKLVKKLRGATYGKDIG